MRWAVVILAVVLWFVFGDPPKNVANWFWPEGAAPWEKVDAFYYPNRDNLFQFVSQIGLDSVDACRSWVNSQANAHNDYGIERGDYECGVGFLHNFGSVRVYRLTVK